MLSRILLFLSLLPAALNAQQWKTVHQQFWMGGLKASSATTCFACGRNNVLDGNVAHTDTDSPSGWNIYGGVGSAIPDLNAFDFLTPQIGIVVGDDGNYAMTSDGGNSWQSAYAGVNADLRNVCYLNADTIYAGGEDYVRRTINGGANWTTIRYINQDWFAGFYAMDFLPGGKGIAGNSGAYYVTSNAGSSWTAYSGTYLQFDLLSNNIVWGVRDSANFNNVRRSINGGATFTTKFSMDNVSLCFLNPAMGWAIDRTQLLLTPDSGNTWIPLTHPDSTLATVTGYWKITFGDAAHGWASLDVDTPLIYYTDDGGNSWTQIQAPMLFSSDQYTHNLQIKNANDSTWALSGKEDLFKTTNKGKSWTRLNLNNATCAHIFSADTIIAGAQVLGAPYKTTNGGLDFTAFSSLPTSDNIYFKNINEGWSVSHGASAIAKTTNGGTSWSNQTAASGHEFFWLTDEIAFVIKWYGSPLYGAVKKTINGGNSWTEVTQLAEGIASQYPFLGLEGIFFLDENTGWVCGQSGYISKSVDGGSTWIQQPTSTSEILIDIKFFDANIGAAISNLGTILETIDGGTTWTTISPLSAAVLNTMFVYDEGFYICGNEGTLIHKDVVPNPDPNDLNGDGELNTSDLLIFISNYGCVGDDCIGDFNGDGQVNSFDFLILLTLI